MSLLRILLDELTITDEASFAHVALYARLKNALREAKYPFHVAAQGTPVSWDRATFLNLTFWSAEEGADVLCENSIPADVVAHVAWHHLATKQLARLAPAAAGAPVRRRALLRRSHRQRVRPVLGGPPATQRARLGLHRHAGLDHGGSRRTGRPRPRGFRSLARVGGVESRAGVRRPAVAAIRRGARAGRLSQCRRRPSACSRALRPTASRPCCTTTSSPTGCSTRARTARRTPLKSAPYTRSTRPCAARRSPSIGSATTGSRRET